MMTSTTLADDILLDTLDHLRGALLAGIVGVDGLSVNMIAFDDDLPHDRGEAEVELSNLIASTSVALARLGVGRTNDLVIQADEITYIISLIIPGYYAVIGMEPTDSLGRARFAIRDLVSRLLTEL